MRAGLRYALVASVIAMVPLACAHERAASRLEPRVQQRADAGRSAVIDLDPSMQRREVIHRFRCDDVRFDGRTAVRVPNVPELEVGTGYFSASVVFSIDEAAKQGMHNLVSKGETVNGVGWQIGYHEWDRASDPSLPAGRIVRGLVAQVSSEGTGGINVDLRCEAPQIYDGQWHAVTLCREGERVVLLLDQRMVAEKRCPELGSVSNSSALVIGRHARDKDYHVGRIATVSFESR